MEKSSLERYPKCPEDTSSVSNDIQASTYFNWPQQMHVRVPMCYKQAAVTCGNIAAAISEPQHPRGAHACSFSRRCTHLPRQHRLPHHHRRHHFSSPFSPPPSSQSSCKSVRAKILLPTKCNHDFATSSREHAV